MNRLERMLKPVRPVHPSFLYPSMINSNSNIVEKCKTEVDQINIENSDPCSQHTSEDLADDLYGALRKFLIFGKLLQLLTFQGVFQPNVQELSFRQRSFSSIMSMLIATVLCVNVVVGLFGIFELAVNGSVVISRAPMMLMFYGTGSFVYIYINKNCSKIIILIQKWNKMACDLEFTTKDEHLHRDVNLITILTIFLAFLENSVQHVQFFPIVKSTGEPFALNQLSSRETENSTWLEVYYYRSHDSWGALVPYSPFTAIFVFISNKFALYSWNFMDILIMIFSRALYFKFRALYEQAKVVVVQGQNHALNKWKRITIDHNSLCEMLEEVDEFLSPLVFLSFAVNLYFICLNMNLMLSPSVQKSSLTSIHALMSFCQVVLRTHIVCLMGSRIHDWAHKLTQLFKFCPDDIYSVVERTERFLNGNTVGLSGLGCFVITKPLILQIIGVVFTFGIILLQANKTNL